MVFDKFSSFPNMNSTKENKWELPWPQQNELDLEHFTTRQIK